MIVVLYFKPTVSQPEKLAGVLEIARKARIHVQVLEEAPSALLARRLKDFWNPGGIIVECGSRSKMVDPNIFAGIPIVYFNHSLEELPPNRFAISHDSLGTGQLAARELLLSGVSDFAFIPERTNPFWSRERERGFVNALKLNGKACRVLSWTKGASTTTERVRRLKSFLAKLPKPCAVFAANDTVAAETITACQLAGIDIPNDLAILGVDNSEGICEHTSPTLSSIEPDFRRGGNLAMLMLLAAMQRRTPFRGTRQRTFGDLRIVRRLSTKRLRKADADVSRALNLIRQKACSGLTAADVARNFACSRRMADLRFSQAVGHSILDEIQSVRLDRAKQLLQNSNQEVKAISDFCGFKNPNSLRKFFRKETGLTLTAWRNRVDAFENRAKSPNGEIWLKIQMPQPWP